jgi:hypothetical protein
LGITQKIKIKINKQRALFCAMVSGQGISNIMGSQPPALGACYFGNAPDLGHYYIECVILELVGFLFNAHLFIFLGFSVCGTRRAK